MRRRPVFPIAVQVVLRACASRPGTAACFPCPSARVSVRVGPACRPADTEALRRLMEANQDLLDRP